MRGLILAATLAAGCSSAPPEPKTSRVAAKPCPDLQDVGRRIGVGVGIGTWRKAAAVATPSTVVVADLGGYAINANFAARNSSGTFTGGVDCTTLTVCGSTFDRQCCKGLTRRTFSDGGATGATCNTIFGVGRGTNSAEVAQGDGTFTAPGAQWAEQSGITAHAKSIDGYAVTRIAGASIGATLPASTITVVSTSQGFAAPTTTLKITTSNGVQTVACTTIGSSTTFTGCSGGTGTMASSAHVEDDAQRPGQLPSLGNAMEWTTNTNDERTFIIWGTQATDPLCVAGLCDDPLGTNVDINGDPMVKGTIYIGVTTWDSNTADTSTFRSWHTTGGANLSGCGQGKKLEHIQFVGDNNNHDVSGILTTCGTATCANGTASASNFFYGSQLGTTAHRDVFKAEIGTVSAACTTPDESTVPTAVTCAAGLHDAWTVWRDTASVGHGVDPGSPTHARIVNERGSNGRSINGVLSSGNTNNQPMRTSEWCIASDYDGAWTCTF